MSLPIRRAQTDGLPDKSKDNRSEDEIKQRFAFKHYFGDGFLYEAANQ